MEKIFVVTSTPKDINNEFKVEPTYLIESYCACINVSDSSCATFDLQKLGMPAFWFPINEIGVWGHSPFFGALKVVNQYYKGDKPVLIHCHAGANRSPSVAYAILRAKGYTVEQAEELLKYPHLSEVFSRNIERKHIPGNIIEFLKAADESPEITAMAGVLRKLDSLYDEWAQKRFNEQNNFHLKGDGDNNNTRLIYSKEKKRFIIVKDPLTESKTMV